jgi:hypothetical protein
MPAPSDPPSASPSSRWAEGANFSISLEGTGSAVLLVWRNAELSRTEGAAAAETMVKHLVHLAATQRGLVLDLSLATTTWGPQTDAALLRMIAPWESRGLPVRVIAADEPIQLIAIKSLLARAAPLHGALASSVQAAIGSGGGKSKGR